MRKRRHIFLGKDSRDERWMEKYEQKKRTNVTKEMKNSTLRSTREYDPFLVDQSGGTTVRFIRGTWCSNIQSFAFSTFASCSIGPIDPRASAWSNQGCATFFFSLAKLNKWNFEQNRICNYLSSWRLVVQIKTNRYREYQRGDDWWFMWK